MNDIGAKVYTIAGNSAASRGPDHFHLEWLREGREVVTHEDYEKALKRILELQDIIGMKADLKSECKILQESNDAFSRRIQELNAKNVSLQSEMKAVLNAASASTNLDITEQLYRVIQERDELKRENEEIRTTFGKAMKLCIKFNS